MFRKVLVANRGEIAVRVIRALREMGISSVTVYSDADRRSLAVRMADEAVRIGPAPSSESYLRIEAILEAAHRTGAEAIHPGYGFLSENAACAAACEDAGIVFIGPSAESIRKVGSKTAARQLAKSAGAPIVPGVEEAVHGVADARAIAAAIGYPVLLKASSGGGGKGMRSVYAEQDMEAALRDASSEAERSFQYGDVYIEKLIAKPRHIEIQVLGDRHGHLIHLGERECSLQRRHQKVIEESPSPVMLQHPELREAMGQAALQVARAAGYYNAGTCEFLVDEDQNFYFLEMNTRLQVEHPVTELVTGLDLVHWQIRIAAGERLNLRQQEVRWRGSAIECRVYAEDPDLNFLPSPGAILSLREPSGPGIRLDSGIYPGWTVPMDYDPLLAKLAAWAEDRPMAIRRLSRAVEEYAVSGIKTNLAFFRRVLADPEFGAGRLHTSFLDEFFARSKQEPAAADLTDLAAIMAAVHAARQKQVAVETAAVESRWRTAGLSELLR
ncbi:MAG TPA: acetyl-CoA carboxylase biotin carboxylase subunit [Bryobacteraceae bacterium]|nr:acetyl-CoA carboxylase biotin carboxylase subunit [Bryobacteraceae bacterium]